MCSHPYQVSNLRSHWNVWATIRQRMHREFPKPYSRWRILHHVFYFHVWIFVFFLSFAIENCNQFKYFLITSCVSILLYKYQCRSAYPKFRPRLQIHLDTMADTYCARLIKTFYDRQDKCTQSKTVSYTLLSHWSDYSKLVVLC